MRSFMNWLAALASLLGLFFTLRDPKTPLTALQIFFVALIVVFVAIAAFIDIKSELERRPKSYKNSAAINNYMYNMLDVAGRCVIYSRDASWAHEAKINGLLQRKAVKRELTLCVPERIPLCDELERLGAEIIEYKRLGVSPSVRFTIANAGNTSTSFVAIGRAIDGRHVIEELDSTHPAYSMATDLISVLRKI